MSVGLNNSIRQAYRWLAGEPALWDQPEPVSYPWTQEPERVTELKRRLETVDRDDQNQLSWHRDRRSGQLWELRIDRLDQGRTEHLRPVSGVERPVAKLVLHGTQLAH